MHGDALENCQSLDVNDSIQKPNGWFKFNDTKMKFIALIHEWIV